MDRMPQSSQHCHQPPWSAPAQPSGSLHNGRLVATSAMRRLVEEHRQREADRLATTPSRTLLLVPGTSVAHTSDESVGVHSGERRFITLIRGGGVSVSNAPGPHSLPAAFFPVGFGTSHMGTSGTPYPRSEKAAGEQKATSVQLPHVNAQIVTSSVSDSAQRMIQLQQQVNTLEAECAALNARATQVLAKLNEDAQQPAGLEMAASALPQQWERMATGALVLEGMDAVRSPRPTRDLTVGAAWALERAHAAAAARTSGQHLPLLLPLRRSRSSKVFTFERPAAGRRCTPAAVTVRVDTPEAGPVGSPMGTGGMGK